MVPYCLSHELLSHRSIVVQTLEKFILIINHSKSQLELVQNIAYLGACFWFDTDLHFHTRQEKSCCQWRRRFSSVSFSFVVGPVPRDCWDANIHYINGEVGMVASLQISFDSGHWGLFIKEWFCIKRNAVYDGGLRDWNWHIAIPSYPSVGQFS